MATKKKSEQELINEVSKLIAEETLQETESPTNIDKVIKAKNSTSENSWQFNYNQYDLYDAYKEYFEQQQKSILNFCTVVMNNMWWWKK